MVTALAREELRRAAMGRPTACAIGVFDGVHRGHQALLARAVESARTRALAPGVVTFHPHPRQVVYPGTQIRYLASLEDRLELLRNAGIACVAPVTFTSELAQADAGAFVRMLVEELELAHLVIGPDFALGRQRGGDPDTLRALGEELGFTVEVIDLLRDGDAKISSTEIRNALAAGTIERVNTLLGRPFSLHGPVVLGQEQGRTIGFPTANIAVGADRALPSAGVYVTRALLDGRAYRSVTNIGYRPTFGDGRALTVECHLLDFEGDLYGRDLRSELMNWLRGEIKFDSIDALRDQIQRDCDAARAMLML